MWLHCKKNNLNAIWLRKIIIFDFYSFFLFLSSDYWKFFAFRCGKMWINMKEHLIKSVVFNDERWIDQLSLLLSISSESNNVYLFFSDFLHNLYKASPTINKNTTETTIIIMSIVLLWSSSHLLVSGLSEYPSRQDKHWLLLTQCQQC